MLNGLPVFEFIIDDTSETGVKTISLVTDPAIGSKFVAFNNDKPKIKYVKLSEETQQSVIGISLQPDLPIYRIDPDTGEEFYGVFTAETIKQIVQKFHKEMNSNNVNLEHDPKAYIDAYMYSDYIVDSELQIEDLKAKGITDAVIGSWVTTYKVEDPEIYQTIVDGTFTGFSVEAYLDKVLKLSQVKNNIITNKLKTEMKKNNKSLLTKIIEIFKEAQVFERALVSELGFEIVWEEVGQPVYKVVVGTDGVETQELVGQGEFATDEGIVVTDEASLLLEVREIPEQVVVVPPVASGDTATLSGATKCVVSGDTSMPDSVTGDTVTSGDTKMRGIDTPISSLVDLTHDGMHTVNVLVEGGFIKEATMETKASLLSKQYAFGDMEKRLKEFVPTDKQGSYTITVDVDSEGNYVWGSVSSWTNLKFHAEPEVQALNARIVELEAKMKEPITEPMLAPEVTAQDFNKMSAYEKLMYKKGVQAVK